MLSLKSNAKAWITLIIVFMTYCLGCMYFSLSTEAQQIVGGCIALICAIVTALLVICVLAILLYLFVVGMKDLLIHLFRRKKAPFSGVEKICNALFVVDLLDDGESDLDVRSITDYFDSYPR